MQITQTLQTLKSLGVHTNRLVSADYCMMNKKGDHLISDEGSQTTWFAKLTNTNWWHQFVLWQQPRVTYTWSPGAWLVHSSGQRSHMLFLGSTGAISPAWASQPTVLQQPLWSLFPTSYLTVPGFPFACCTWYCAVPSWLADSVSLDYPPSRGYHSATIAKTKWLSDVFAVGHRVEVLLALGVQLDVIHVVEVADGCPIS